DDQRQRSHRHPRAAGSIDAPTVKGSPAMKHSRSRALFGLMAAPLLLASLAACSTDTAPAEESTGSVDTTSLETMMEEFQQPLTEEVPESSPAIETGKSVVVIPCTYASEACARGADSAMEAAEYLGWETRMIDPGG